MGAEDHLSPHQFRLGPLFHGTTSDRADRILESGFEPGVDESRGAVWLARDEEHAHSYASRRAEREGKQPAVIRVESVEGRPSEYMNFKMARESGADFNDFGHEVAVHNSRAIKGLRRIR